MFELPRLLTCEDPSSYCQGDESPARTCDQFHLTKSCIVICCHFPCTDTFVVNTSARIIFYIARVTGLERPEERGFPS